MDLMPFMTQHHMLPPAGGRILCAVSGGRDSMCLLHYLWQLGQQENFTVAAVHMDHGQRDTAQRTYSSCRISAGSGGSPA